MSRRDIVAFVLGVASALAVVLAVAPSDRRFIGSAFAQPTPDRQQYLLVLGIANALSSLAVDSERTAVGLNDAIDRVMVLEDRLQQAEKRIETLERSR